MIFRKWFKRVYIGTILLHRRESLTSSNFKQLVSKCVYLRLRLFSDFKQGLHKMIQIRPPLEEKTAFVLKQGFTVRWPCTAGEGVTATAWVNYSRFTH